MKTYAYISKSLISDLSDNPKYNLINAKTREIFLQNSSIAEIKKYINDNDLVIIAGREYL